jgi:predicted transcriptional regulator
VKLKLFATVSFLFTFILLAHTTFSQIQYYGIDAFVGPEGRTQVKLVITFLNPEERIDFKIFGRIENFYASSNAGPVKCDLSKGEASLINCKMNLTHQKRTLEIEFETRDFVKRVNDKYYLNADLSLGQNIDSLFASFKLSEGFLISTKNEISQIFPQEATIVSDGRHIIVNWNLQNVEAEKPIKFEIFYEPIAKGLEVWQLILVGILAALLTAALIYRRTKKAKEAILSVLDKYERKVLELIASAEQINQKKIVQATNLSKAKVSRIVKKLSEKGLIKVERRGRTNILKIVKKKLLI